MSTFCSRFVPGNAWRSNICTNCFRHQDEHRHENSVNRQSQQQFVQIPRIPSNRNSTSRATSDNRTSVVNSGGSHLMSQFAAGSSLSHKQQHVGKSGSGGSSISVSFSNTNVHKARMEGERRPNFSVGGAMRGILKSNEKGKSPKSKGVKFPEEVVEVIGYGDEVNQNLSDDEDDSGSSPLDPQDNASIADIMEKNSNTLDEKEFHKLTQKNTNFNSIKTNLLGKTNIQLGPIVGGTGGSSKPLVSIGTFESRQQPLAIRKKIDEDSQDVVDVNSTRKFVAKSVTNKVPTTKPSPIATNVVPICKPMQTSTKTASSFSAPNTISVALVPPNSALRKKEGSPPIAPKPSTVSISSAKDCWKERKSKEPTESKNEVTLGTKLDPKNKPSSAIKSILKASSPPPTEALSKELPPILPPTKDKFQAKNALTNLIILTEGNKIASKRTSFLRDIIEQGTNKQVSDSNGVTIVPTQSLLDTGSFQGEKDSLEEVVPKLPSKFNVNLDLALANPPKPSSLSLVSSNIFNAVGSGTDSEFDDSLEDSGLDIKVNQNVNGSSPDQAGGESSSDEPGSSSASDSGNENDYRLNNKEKEDKLKNNGLYISVEDEELKLNAKTLCPSKLSPDSVLFNNSASGSENSASGSSESIPELMQDRRESTISNSSGNSKRQAPLPPQTLPPEEAEEGEEEEVYDDVANLKPFQSEQEVEDESIYDDCVALNEAKGKIGSYNFQESIESRDLDDEPVVAKRSDGIEFIGIRKIDSELFLNSSPEKRVGFRSSASPEKSPSSRERSSSTSPKTRRKVNQFFSTIGKKAGAAFNSSQLAQYATGRSSKSPSVFSASGSDPSKALEPKRSHSSDEVSSSRAQEIYATLTPTTLKFKGMLNKLSKIELNLQKPEEEDGSSKDKKNKTHKMSAFKKFLRIGPAKDDMPFNNPTSTSNNMVISSPIIIQPSLSSSEFTDDSFKSSLTPPPNKPPPPPPRVHSIDFLNKVGVELSHKGTISGKPARPPPPKFTAVFNNNPNTATSTTSTTLEDEAGPPCKPRRKNSIVQNGSKELLETSYNHIANLNLETLKLIANQPVAKITSKCSNFSSDEKLSWSQFDVQSGLRPDPLIHGTGFAFYSAHFEGIKYILLIQEDFQEAIQHKIYCLPTEITFQDVVPIEFVTWEPSKAVSFDCGIKGFISVLPFCSIWSLSDFIKSCGIPQRQKHLAILQSLDFWDASTPIEALMVIRQPNNSEMIFVHPMPQNNFQTCDFEVSIKQLLFTFSEEHSDSDGILTQSDKNILIQKISGGGQAVKSQLQLFFQLKLFSPDKNSEEFIRIRKYRSEHAIQQWLDKERALCMKTAVERSLRNNSSSDCITPSKKCYLEFLMSGYSAKTMLEMFVDLFEE